MITTTVNNIPNDYRWANAYEAEDASSLIDAVYVRREFDQVDIAVPANHPLPCEREFGEHDCTGDDDCPAMEIVFDMSAPMPSDYLSYDYPGYNPGYDHFEKFGRPAAPNEY